MAASLSDILTTAQNLVKAVTAAAQIYQNAQGNANVAGIAAAMVVKNSAGRVVTVSVTVAGSAPGGVYDTTSTSDTTRLLGVIPNTVGVFSVNLATQYGIMVAPGTSQVLTVGYS